MQKILAGFILATAALGFAGTADAAGCIKGAIVGGVAGHMVGHGKMGAAAGCAIGHHNAAKKANAQGADAQPSQPPKQ